MEHISDKGREKAARNSTLHSLLVVEWLLEIVFGPVAPVRANLALFQRQYRHIMKYMEMCHLAKNDISAGWLRSI